MSTFWPGGFLEQSVNVLEVTRVWGTALANFFSRISTSARPAIAIGVALALMETLNDFGTVDYFAVQTMTAALFDVWQGMGSLAGGAQIATTMLAFVILLISIERFSRRKQRVYQSVRVVFVSYLPIVLKDFPVYWPSPPVWCQYL
ncbi:MAG: hypothetical protein CM1200mP18_00560 [Gammaproteobacteria bacterium]|nr:MAG: hypothetical protein CM1200mP18_00560 [Gammaproteobacteria bacterium]